MQLHVFSDLHLGFPGSWRPELAAGADVVVCAGDVCEGLPEAMAVLRACIPAPTTILTVAGNHSFYGRAINTEWPPGRAAAQEHGVTLLEREDAVIGGVRFIGATLWTDYALYGDLDRGPAMVRAQCEMNDHRLITWRYEPLERFRPAHALAMHVEAAEAIDALLARPFAGPTVVVTHHGPSPRSIARQHQGNGLNPAFCSDMTELIRRHQPAAWIHGHMHCSADYRIGRTRCSITRTGTGRSMRAGSSQASLSRLRDERRLWERPFSEAVRPGPSGH